MKTVNENLTSDNDSSDQEDHDIQALDPARNAHSTVASTYFDEKIHIPDADSVSIRSFYS